MALLWCTDERHLQTATVGDVVRGRVLGRTRNGLTVEMFDPTWLGDIVLPYISKQEWKECFVALARVSPKPRGGLCIFVRNIVSKFQSYSFCKRALASSV